MALVLSQNIRMGSLDFTYISYKVCFIQMTWVEHVIVVMYSNSIVDKETEHYFLLNHDTRKPPK